MAGWRRMLEWLEDAHLLRGEPGHDGPSALTGSKRGVAGWAREGPSRLQRIRGVPSEIDRGTPVQPTPDEGNGQGERLRKQSVEQPVEADEAQWPKWVRFAA